MTEQHTSIHGFLTLLADPRRGTWATELRLKTGKVTRTGGQLPTSTTAHGLLLVALRSALRSISPRQLTGRKGRRVRLLVNTNDRTFADALGRVQNSGSGTVPPLRAGRNQLDDLQKELARFDIVFVTDVDDSHYKFRALDRWLREHVIDPRETIPHTFAATTVAITDAAI